MRIPLKIEKNEIGDEMIYFDLNIPRYVSTRKYKTYQMTFVCSRRYNSFILILFSLACPSHNLEQLKSELHLRDLDSASSQQSIRNNSMTHFSGSRAPLGNNYQPPILATIVDVISVTNCEYCQKSCADIKFILPIYLIMSQ